jgi:CheY-like chemotaxis protein
LVDQGKRNGKKQSLDTFQLNSGEHLSVARDGYCLQIEVSDTGAGMSQDQLAQLFRDGVQFNVNNLQAGQGSGIGLYISKGIVEQHGGTLMATSEGLGEGTTFTITMPIFKVPDNVLPSQLLRHLQVSKQSPEVPIGGDAENPESGGGGEGVVEALRILVVDDSLMNRKLLMRLLKNRGHECDEAKDGQEAFDKVTESLQRDNCYDTILMDYEMPVMDGPTASMEIRALGCDSFIVGITGNVLPEDVAHFRRCGANCVFPKPIQMEALEGIWNEFGVTGRGSPGRREI